MAETASNVSIQDIPARYHPYRDLILNAAFGKVFTPEALSRGQLPGANNQWGNVAPPPTTNVQTAQPGQAMPQMGPDQGTRLLNSNPQSALQRAAADIEQSLRIGYAGGGQPGRLAASADDLERSLFGGGVNLGAGGSPIGGYYPPMVVSPPANIPTQIGTGTQTPPPPRPPYVTPPSTATPGGIINTNPSGVLPVGNPNPNPPPFGTPGIPHGQAPPQGGVPPQGGGGAPPPGAGAGSTDPMFLANRPNNFAGAQQATSSGYNPNQYADDSVANDLAKRLGAQNVYTNTGGPNGPPSQATLSFGGNAFMNAGLVNQAMQTEDVGLRELRLNGIRDEIRKLGGTPGFSQGGTVRAATGFNGSLNPFGQQAMRSSVPASPSSSSAQPSASDPLTLGMGGSDAPAPNPFAGVTPAAGSTSTQNAAFSVLNPYQAYGGQRTLGMGGNFGQVGTDKTLQVSDQTRAGLQGVSGLPSYFENGEIRDGRGPDGRPTTNFGIANDTFETSGNLAINAAQNAEEASYKNPLQSTFGNTMRYLQDNPNQFSAGDISLGKLTAPQLDAPMGISPSQLTSYQMAGPRMVDTSGSNINPLYIGNPNVRDFTADGRGSSITGEGYSAASMGPAGRFIDPNNPADYMSPYQQAVTDTRLSQAQRNFDENKQVRSAQAVRAGSFGGSRQAVADSLAGRDLAIQKDSITAEGAQSAYENAQQQYERDRQARLMVGQANQNASNMASQFTAGNRQQASLSNQDNGRQFGLANLAALMQTQQLGATLGQDAARSNQSAALQAAGQNQQTGLQAQLANQSALQQSNQVNLNAALGVQELGANQSLASQQANQSAGLNAGQSNQQAALATQALARGSGLTAAQANQSTRLTQNQALLSAQAQADQLQQQAAQGNATNRLNAMGQQTNSALAANNIGQSRADLTRLAQAMELQRLQALQGAGAQTDARTQQSVDMGYQDFINQSNMPYQQLNWLQSILNGTPMGVNQEQVMFNRTNPMAQATGLATAGLGALSSYMGNR